MKKITALLLSVLMLLAFSGCSQPVQEESPPDMELQVSQMMTICELATIDCYYHNVAKFEEKNATGAWFWAKDKHFWIEYDGVVTLGIDVSKVEINVEGTHVTISLPQAQVLDCKIDSTSLSKESFIVAKSSAEIEVSDEVEATAAAQEQMLTTAQNNAALLASARQKAQRLLEEYINNIGSAVGKQFSITWE